MKKILIVPNGELARVVRYFWAFEMKDVPHRDFLIQTFVDDSTGMVVHHNEGKSVLSTQGKQLPTGLIYGRFTKPSWTSVSSGFSAVGVSFQPQAIPALIGVDAYYLADRIYKAKDVDSRWDLEEKILNETDLNKGIGHLSDFILHKLTTRRQDDPVVSGALTFVGNGKYKRVSDIMQDFKISERQLERRFLASIGVSPRHCIQLVRFENVIQILRNDKQTPLIDLSFKLGFADQPHFTRFVKKFSGTTPGMLRSRLQGDMLNLLLDQEVEEL
jgi:AraC-like DNA-binding protein